MLLAWACVCLSYQIEFRLISALEREAETGGPQFNTSWRRLKETWKNVWERKALASSRPWV